MDNYKLIQWGYSPNPSQKRLQDAQSRYLLFGGARGSGKTTSLVNKILIHLWQYPGSRGFLCRKVFLDFRMTTYQTLLKCLIPAVVKKSNELNKEIEFVNGSKLLYGGLDDRKDIERMRGAEFSIVGGDQIEEFLEEEFNELCTTLRLVLPDGSRPPYQGVFTANPSQNWVKSRFINSTDSDYEFIQAMPKDNIVHLPPDYYDKLKKLWKNRPEMVKAYVEGDWDAMAQENAVIKWDWIETASKCENIRPYEGATKRIIACDVSRSIGGDLNVCWALRNYEIIGEESWHEPDTMKTAGKLVVLKERFKANQIVVDCIGWGAGVVDRLREMNQPVISINSTEKSDYPDRFLNKRAEIWWMTADKFADSMVRIPNDKELKTELASFKYKVLNSKGMIQIEDKKEIRALLGRSPDRADALAYGIWAIERASPYGEDTHRISRHHIKAESQIANMLSAVGQRGGW